MLPIWEPEGSLDAATRHARAWLDGLGTRPVPAQASVERMLEVFGGPLPEDGSDAEAVIDCLGAQAPPGLVAMGSGRFFGFVIGGTHPVALAADWLVSAWDQNAGLRQVTTANSAIEETAAAWLLELLGLPAGSGVGFRPCEDVGAAATGQGHIADRPHFPWRARRGIAAQHPHAGRGAPQHRPRLRPRKTGSARPKARAWKFRLVIGPWRGSGFSQGSQDRRFTPGNSQA